MRTRGPIVFLLIGAMTVLSACHPHSSEPQADTKAPQFRTDERIYEICYDGVRYLALRLGTSAGVLTPKIN